MDSGTPIPVSGDGTHTLTYRPIDWAGRAGATQTTTIRIDSAAPQVTCGGPDGAWHAHDATLGCTAVDPAPGSGVAPASDASVAISTAVAAGSETANASTQPHQFCDVAGNCTTQPPIAGNKIDKRPPTIQLTGPTDGATYTLGQTITADYSCTDGGSGVASCTGAVANGGNVDTSSVGTKQFQVTSTDGVGNTATVTATYTVHYQFTGFLPTIVNPPTVNAALAGLAVPVLFSLKGYHGQTVLAAGSPVSHQIACGTTTATGPDTPATAVAPIGLAYDRLLDLYTYFWSTPRAWAGTCRQLTVTFADGTSHTALLKFR